MSITLDFNQQQVLVVGGTSGINRGIAEHFAEHGANVAVISRNPEKVQDTLQRLQQIRPAKHLGFCADVRDYAALERALEQLGQQWPRIDVLVSGAAGNFPALAMGMSPNAFRSVIEIDLLGTYHVMRAAYPLLRKPGATVINISAPQAQLAMEGQSHVCAAKAGVDMITRTLALEWGAAGIRVNSVIPGAIDQTEGMQRLAPSAAHRQAVVDTIPLGRLGQVGDIANVCLLLASPLGSYINGAIVPVDGGWSQAGCGDLPRQLGQLLRTVNPDR